MVSLAACLATDFMIFTEMMCCDSVDFLVHKLREPFPHLPQEWLLILSYRVKVVFKGF